MANSEEQARKLASFLNETLRADAPEQFFEDIVDLAARLCRARTIVLAFPDEHGLWFKARRGIELTEVAGKKDVLTQTLQHRAPLLVVPPFPEADALIEASRARFFLGVPIFAAGSQPIGVLAVMDEDELSAQVETVSAALLILARQVAEEIEQRYCAADRESKHMERFEFIANNVQDLIAVLDVRGNRLYNNKAYQDILGDPKTLRGTYAFDQIHQEDRDQVREVFDRTVSSGAGSRAEFRFVLPDGSMRHMESQGIPIVDMTGKVKEVVVVTHDVTTHKLNVENQRRRNQQLTARNDQLDELNRMASYLHRCDSIEDIMTVVLQHQASLFGEGIGGIYRFDPQLVQFELLESWGDKSAVAPLFSTNECWAVKNDSGFHLVERANLQHALCCKHVTDLKFPYLCVSATGKGNCKVMLHLQLTEQPDSDSREEQRLWMEARRELATALAQHVAVAIENLGRRQELEAAALTDALTGLYGRRFVQEELWKKIAIVKRNKTTLGIVAVDIDHFKRINDTYGHDAGDYVLRGVAKFLQAQLRESDYACRTGGEEFMLILTNPADEESVLMVAEKVREGAKALVFHFEGRPIKVTLSLGVTFLSGKALESNRATGEFAKEKAAELTRVVDEALYQAKQERDKVVFLEGKK